MLLMPMLYLPPLSYMALLSAAGEAHIEAQENYIKSTYRNRCEILGANGIITLSIPLQGGRDHHQLYRESKISYTDHWQHRHMMSILSSYGSSPFYEHYAGYFEMFYQKKYENLYEFNKALFLLLIKLMKLDITLIYTEHYEKNPTNLVDLRNAFKPSRHISDINVGQKKWYLQEVPYIKVFGSVYVISAHVSCLDLLFNTGPECRDILKKMVAIN